MFLKPPARSLLQLGHPINYSCVGAWLLGEGQGARCYDSSTNRNDAIYTNSGGGSPWTPSPWAPGMRGGVAYRMLAPSNQRLATANFSPPNENFTVSVWLQPQDWHDYGCFVGAWDGGGTFAWQLAQFSDGKVYAYSSSNSSSYRFYNSDTTIAIGAKVMVTVVYGASGEATLVYFNGVAQATSTGGTEAYSGIVTTAQPIRFGYSDNFAGSAHGVHGNFENARFWSRKLSATEILALYTEPYLGYRDPAPDRKFYFYSAAATGAGISAHSMAAEAAAFILTGQDVGTSAARRMAADAASFALTGNAVIFRGGKSLSAEPAHFFLTGRAVDFLSSQPYLPRASSGLNYTFAVRDSVTKKARSGDTIYDGASTGTEIRSTQRHATLTLISPTRGKWFVAKKTGTWSLT